MGRLILLFRYSGVSFFTQSVIWFLFKRRSWRSERMYRNPHEALKSIVSLKKMYINDVVAKKPPVQNLGSKS
jgi:hypothetical protein